MRISTPPARPYGEKFQAQGCDGEEDDHGDKSLFPLIRFKDDGGGDHGNPRVDGTGVGTATASVRAERSCKGNGRVYHISFTATGPADR